MPAPLLSIHALHKRFAVPVLKGIELELLAGEVHALMGANGAGKTTLCNIICGFLAADSGDMRYQGNDYAPSTPADSQSRNIRMVMQELKLIDNLSVAENLFLGELPTRYGFVDFNKLFDSAQQVLDRFGLQDIDPRQTMSSLGIGQQQLLEIARVLIHPCDLLLLDEPTAALTEPQVDLLFNEITKLKENGTGILYVSHRMDEIKRISDQITVLRDGQTMASAKADDISQKEIIKLMSGQESNDASHYCKREKGPLALRINNLSTRERLSDISLDLYHGEILGIGGLVGSGRTELLRAIYGADHISSGHIQLAGDAKREIKNDPLLAVKNGIGFITEDRKQQGLLLTQAIESNMSLASLDKFSNKLGWLNRKNEHDNTEAHRQALDIKFDHSRQAIRELSGGNQQKVIIARWLSKQCDILLFDEPTRGIDIQTKLMIYALLDELARKGTAIMIVSSETEELLAVCDRIAVMSNGYLAAGFEREEFNLENLTAAAFSRYTGADAA